MTSSPSIALRARKARRDALHANLICGAAIAFLLAILVGAVGGANPRSSSEAVAQTKTRVSSEAAGPIK